MASKLRFGIARQDGTPRGPYWEIRIPDGGDDAYIRESATRSLMHASLLLAVSRRHPHRMISAGSDRDSSTVGDDAANPLPDSGDVPNLEAAPRNPDAFARKAAVAGIVFAALFLVGFWMLAGVPSSNASDREIADYYGGSERDVAIVAAFYIVPFAGIAFLWFLASLRHRVQRAAGADEVLISTVQLLSGVLFVAMMFAAAAGRAATAAATRYSDAAIPRAGETRALMALSESFSGVFAVRAAAVFVAAGTTQVRRAELFPRWFVAASYVVAVLLLFTTTFFWPIVTIFPVWVAVVSVLILRRNPPAPEAAAERPETPQIDLCEDGRSLKAARSDRGNRAPPQQQRMDT